MPMAREVYGGKWIIDNSAGREERLTEIILTVLKGWYTNISFGGNGRHLRKFTSILLFLLLMLAHGAAADAAEPSHGTIKLLNPDIWPGNAPPSLLVRELARQSVLIAARDGLGLY